MQSSFKYLGLLHQQLISCLFCTVLSFWPVSYTPLTSGLLRSLVTKCKAHKMKTFSPAVVRTYCCNANGKIDAAPGIKYEKDLVRSGMRQPQAQVSVYSHEALHCKSVSQQWTCPPQALIGVLSDFTRPLATEKLVLETKVALETQIVDTKVALETKIDDTKTSLVKQIADTKKGLETKIDDTKKGLDDKIDLHAKWSFWAFLFLLSFILVVAGASADPSSIMGQLVAFLLSLLNRRG